MAIVTKIPRLIVDIMTGHVSVCMDAHVCLCLLGACLCRSRVSMYINNMCVCVCMVYICVCICVLLLHEFNFYCKWCAVTLCLTPRVKSGTQ